MSPQAGQATEHVTSAVQDPAGGGVPAGRSEPGAALPGLPERQPGLADVWRRGPNAGGVQLQRRQPPLQHHGQQCGARWASPPLRTQRAASVRPPSYIPTVWAAAVDGARSDVAPHAWSHVFELTVAFPLQARLHPGQVRGFPSGARRVVAASDWLSVALSCALNRRSTRSPFSDCDSLNSLTVALLVLCMEINASWSLNLIAETLNHFVSRFFSWQSIKHEEVQIN